MLYNVDFTISALFVLAFLFSHYLRNGKSLRGLSRLFSVFLVYLFALGVFDIVEIFFLADNRVPQALSFGLCTIYMCMEIYTAPLLMNFLPIAIADNSKRTLGWLHRISIPAYLCMVAILLVNPATGFIFTINPTTSLYESGPYSFLLLVCNGFYLILAAIIIVRNRRSIDLYRIISICQMLVIGVTGLFAQGAFPQTRLTVFCYTAIALEMYLSYQIPERRTDSLTGLYNRDAFCEITERMLTRNPHASFVMVYTNIVKFKAVNELYGPQMGDHILAGFAQTIRTCFAEDGTAGRLQSDHFAFCVPKQSFNLENILTTTNAAVFQNEYGCDINVVYGIYETNDPTCSASVMCDRARLAMNRIMWSRSNRFALYEDAEGKHFLADYEISSQMETAIEAKQFEVYLQPIFRLSDSSLVGAEALVRWNHPEKGLMSPCDFIPVFERTGQIAQLDEFVWETVCKTLRSWRDRELPLHPVSMNISRVDLQPGLNTTIANLFDRYDIDPELARFEITESVYIEHVDQLTLFINGLHAAGFHVHLDDFGSGYSSLSVLENAPFDAIKIDHEFVANVMTNERSRTVLKATIRLASELGLPVITEGIETEEEAQLVRQMGSDFAQGYLYGSPMDLDTFERTLLTTENPLSS